MMLKLFEVKCYVDDGMSRYTTTKRILCYTTRDARETILRMYLEDGDIAEVLSVKEIEMHDRMILS